MEIVRGTRGRIRAALMTLCILIAAASVRAEEPVRHSVWFDTDLAMGVERADVDDGLALIQTIHSPEIELRGISLVFGNGPLAEQFDVAREILVRYGSVADRALSFHAGAGGAQDYGRSTPAVRAMAAALRERPMTILALGPVTNVGTLIALHPELEPRIERIIMVAGRRPGQKFQTSEKYPRPHRDFNFEHDPVAMQTLLDTDIALEFAPWEVSSHVWLTRQDLAEIGRSGPNGKWIEETCDPWITMWETQLGARGFNPFDTLAVARVTHPGTIEFFEGVCVIERGPDDRATREQVAAGEVPEKPYLVVRPVAEAEGRRVVYCFKPTDEFKPTLVRRLSGPDRAAGQ